MCASNKHKVERKVERESEDNMFQASIMEQLQGPPQYTSDGEIGRIGREDDFESKSGGSENHDFGSASGDDQADPASQRSKRKRYHRHTQLQIQEMESFFKECPHPDDKQRKELGRRLNLEPLQVKFWFQNKRTQVKTQNERYENTQLRNENDRLRADNMRYKEALATSACPNCGGPTAVGELSFDEQHLRVENIRLREEIDRISGIAAKYVGKPVLEYPLSVPPVSPRRLELGPATMNFSGGQPVVGMGAGGQEMFGPGPGDFLRLVGGQTETDKPMVIELAVAAMEELVRMAQMGEPLWLPTLDGTSMVLNESEYLRTFPHGMGPRPAGFKLEVSREVAVVAMNHDRLVEILMDAVQMSSVFSGIVSRAMTLEVLSTGVAGNYNGALQVMTAEFQVPTPLVPTREFYFVRYCKQHAEGTWAIVDVSLDGVRPTPGMRCRRKPSGCLIENMHNGYSKVTWVEHIEVDDRGVHNLYRPLVTSLLAFGAKRWTSTLSRQCERLASTMSTNLCADEEVMSSPEGRRGMMKLAQRMVISFFAGVSASTAHTWTTLSGSGADDVRVMTRKSVDDPGRPPGIVLSAATSFWLPVSPKRVFNFLRDENSRNEWDVLSDCGIVQEMLHTANGRDTGNCVSLLKIDSTNSNQGNVLILQESCTDPTASYVIYAPVDAVSVNMVLTGNGDPDYVHLLPSGFAILPYGTPDGGAMGEAGSLLTVAFQILVDSTPTAKLALGSVATANNLIVCTVEKIKAALSCQSA